MFVKFIPDFYDGGIKTFCYEAHKLPQKRWFMNSLSVKSEKEQFDEEMTVTRTVLKQLCTKSLTRMQKLEIKTTYYY